MRYLLRFFTSGAELFWPIITFALLYLYGYIHDFYISFVIFGSLYTTLIYFYRKRKIAYVPRSYKLYVASALVFYGGFATISLSGDVGTVDAAGLALLFSGGVLLQIGKCMEAFGK